MKIRPLKLDGAFELTFDPKYDERGYFMRVYDEAIFAEYGLVTGWVQENQSLSKRKGIIRGLHFQKPPHTDTKLVRVTRGAVYDVLVDLRKDSDTYCRWEAVILSEEKLNMVYVPKGFAHGFCSLTENVVVHYKVDQAYAPASDSGIRWDDKTWNIPWPTDDPYLSDKDEALPFFEAILSPF